MKTLKIPVKIIGNKIIPLQTLPQIKKNNENFIIIQKKNTTKQKKFLNHNVAEHLGKIKSNLSRENIYSD